MSDTLNDMQAGQNAADFLRQNSGDYAPAFKFAAVGDQIAGTIIRTAVVDGTSLQGTAQRSLVVEVETDSGEKAAIWVAESKPRLVRAVREACEAAGVSSPTVGDRIGVRFESELAPTKPGYSPSKVFAAQYKRAERTATQSAPAASDLI